MRISILAILLLLPTLACAQITASLNYDKQKDVLELIVGNESRDCDIYVFDVYDGARYSSTITPRYSKTGVEYESFITGLREKESLIPIKPMQEERFAFSWFPALRDKGVRFFDISYTIVYASVDEAGEKVVKSHKGKLKFEVDVIHTISLEDIESEYFREVFNSSEHTGFLKLPFVYDASFTKSWMSKKIKPVSYSYPVTDSPFFVNVRKSSQARNDAETRVQFMLDESVGDFLICIIYAISADHNANKSWLATFDFQGNLIDYIPIGEVHGNRIRTIEAQIHNNFIIDVQKLEFPHNDFIIKDFKPVEGLKGERMDVSYKLAGSGKFIKIRETSYLPQNYSSETLLNRKMRISGRGEVKKEIN
ncbi:MAG: hypothetical protein J6C87_09840 [Bacteroides sp.]|nr:hypothetical protein [Bacteroides sp.]